METLKKTLYKGVGLLFSIFIIFLNQSFAQLQVDYPFKAISNSNGEIFVTGEVYNGSNGTQDIFIKKITSSGIAYEIKYPSSFGDDKGYSLALDVNENIIITGYIHNEETDSKDIIILKYSSSGGLIWDTVLASPYEDAGLSVTIFNGYDIAICGYQTNDGTEKDFFMHVMDEDKDPIHTDVISFSDNDDVATSVLVDDDYVYIVGYFYNGEVFENDFKSIAYYMDGWSLAENIDVNEKYNQYPTNFIITEYETEQPAVKAKRAVTLQFDETGNNHFWTVHFDGNNTTEPLLWTQVYDNTTNDIPTAVTSDYDFVYSVGYTEQTSGYDYVILKYNKSDGDPNYGFPIIYDYEQEQGDDKPSSIKLDGEMLYITGYNESSTYEYTVLGFSMFPDSPLEEIGPVWAKSYVPELNGINLRDVKKYTYCTTDREGNVILMAFGYNDSVSFIAGQTYNREGNVLSSIQPQIMRGKEKIKHTVSNGEQVQINNYPNPFNPVTNISFTIPVSNFVELTIFDMSGRQIETLVKNQLNAGSHIVKWDATNYSSGIYFYRLKTNSSIITKKLVLVK